MVLPALLLVVAACAGGAMPSPGSAAKPAAPVVFPTPAPTHFELYAGAYRADDGTTFAVNGLGHVARLTDGWFRQLHATPVADRFEVGPGFQTPTPKQADVIFHVIGGQADQMTVSPSSGPALTARRLGLRQTDARITAGEVELAATITEPATPGQHPGIVIVHGSERGTRILYGIWVNYYASLGFTVLAYDKRGAGDSGGRYPGELATTQNLNVYAADAAACLRYLSSWPGVDPRRVGFHGGSQGGWTVPLAIRAVPATAFAVLASAPAVSVDQQGTWAGYTNGSRQWRAAPQSEIDAGFQTPSVGYDPGPVLAATKTPILWLNGELDGQVPTRLNTQVLNRLGRPNFESIVFPGTGHSLLQSGTGFVTDDDRAPGFPPDLFDRASAWLAAHAGTSPGF